jgi:hypothetical protein
MELADDRRLVHPVQKAVSTLRHLQAAQGLGGTASLFHQTARFLLLMALGSAQTIDLGILFHLLDVEAVGSAHDGRRPSEPFGDGVEAWYVSGSAEHDFDL